MRNAVVALLSNDFKYIFGILLLSFICFTSVGSILIYGPPDQKFVLISAVLGFLSLTTGQLIALIKTDRAAVLAAGAAEKSSETHDLVNGQSEKYQEQMRTLMEVSNRVRYLEGHISGHALGMEQQKAVQDELAAATKGEQGEPGEAGPRGRPGKDA